MTSTQPSPIKQVNCPTCQRIVPWQEESQYRPFCSQKCQLIDFGEWANERHSIPVEEEALDGLSFPDQDLQQHKDTH